MTKRISSGMCAVCALLCIAINLGCSKSQATERGGKADGAGKEITGQVSVAQAERLVADWVKEHRDECNWHDRPKLTEATTEEIRTKLKAQVFRLSDWTASIPEVEAYLIKDGKPYPMTVGLGGWGLMDTCVCDIDGDSKQELVYTYSCGSGLHRSLIEAYRFSGPTPKKTSTSFAVTNADVVVKQKGANVFAYAAEMSRGKDGTPSFRAKLRLGKLILRREKDGEVLDIESDPGLPKEWNDLIWRKHEPAAE